MRAIGDVIPGVVAQIDERRRKLRADLARTHGFAPDAHCMWCGDHGYQPGPAHRPCLACEKGRDIAERLQRSERWSREIPRRFRDYTLEGHPDQGAVAKAREWIARESGGGRNLLVMGPVGTGKTGLAIGALREIFIAGRNIKFGTVPDLLEGMRPQDGRPNPNEAVTMSGLQRVPVLLMDDLGAEKATDWVAERLYMVINGRYERRLPTVVTTNRSVDALRISAGTRAMSRLLEDYDGLVVDGPDRRRTGGTRP